MGPIITPLCERACSVVRTYPHLLTSSSEVAHVIGVTFTRSLISVTFEMKDEEVSILVVPLKVFGDDKALKVYAEKRKRK